MRVLFFGRLRDLAGTSELQMTQEFETLADLRRWLTENYPELGPALARSGVRVAVDKAIIANDQASLRAAKEIAFMPPMSGG